MKRTLTVNTAALLSTALATPLMAQTPPVFAHGEHHPNVEGFDSYLESHPEEREALNRDPHLIDDPKYLKNHTDLHSYMQAHPDQASPFRHHPDIFINREHVLNRCEKRYDRHHHEP